VRLGEYDFDQEGETKDQTFTLASMKIHERYDDVTFENDIAILKLNGVATRSESVWPICLPPPNEQFTNRRAFVIGERLLVLVLELVLLLVLVLELAFVLAFV